MRLLYLSADPGVPVLGHKGASVHVRELVVALTAAGASVVLASPRTRFEGDRIERAVELVEIEPVLPKEHATAASLRRAVRDQSAQVEALARELGAEAVYERYSLFSDAGIRTAAALGVPHVLEVNSPLRDEARRFRSLPHPEEAAAIEAAVLATTDRIFAVSAELRNALVRGGVASAKITVSPNAVDPAKFPPRQRAAAAPFTIGFCGSLKPWHGVEVLLEAFRASVAEEQGLRLEFVGTGPAEQAAVGADLPAGSLVLHGVLPHRAAIETMAGWNVGVAPFLPVPRFYFSPLKVLEYMAAGLATVASDLGQIRALLGDGERGLLVRAGDPTALSAALVALARDPARAAELGARARQHVLSSFTWARNAERALAALRALPVEQVA